MDQRNVSGIESRKSRRIRASLGATLTILLVGFAPQALAMGALSSHSSSNDAYEAFGIPDAKCADGSDYNIYIKKGDPKKVVIHFQGGGACWNKETCYGLVPLTRLKEKVDLAEDPIVAHQPQHPLADYTYVYLPYCTGDIYAGSHVADYDGQHPEHLGKTNMEKTFQWLNSVAAAKLVDAEKVFVYGESSGAIGAILNLDLVESSISKNAERYLMADAPGLHFNKNIWKRFSNQYLADVSDAMKPNGLHFDPNDGVIASQMGNFCRNYPNWRIGILQGTQDFIMSVVFGELSPSDHEKLVLGSSGIYQTLQDSSDNCASWSPQTQEHTFLRKAKSRGIKTSDGALPTDFLNDLLNPTPGVFLSHK